MLFSSDTYIQKAKKTYADSRGRRNLSALNSELHDVQRIMVQNIDDVLQRGVVMSGKNVRTSGNSRVGCNLLMMSKREVFIIFILQSWIQRLKIFRGGQPTSGRRPAPSTPLRGSPSGPGSLSCSLCSSSGTGSCSSRTSCPSLPCCRRQKLYQRKFIPVHE